MQWQYLFIVALLVALLLFGLVGYWRGGGVSSCCDPTRKSKQNTRQS